jgi:hypothetical protein
LINDSLPELYCTLPGHRSAGMTLDIQIHEPEGAVPPRVTMISPTRRESRP